jgi:hypothetical protein
MNFEQLQDVWQHEAGGAKISIRADVLLRELQHNQQHFRNTILWRDVREIGVTGIMTLVFGYLGIRDRQWSFHVLALACCGVGIFMLIDRWHQRRQRPVKTVPVRSCVEASLTEVNHQIWLLKNVIWWYLLPFQVGVGAFVCSIVWQARHAGPAVLAGLGGFALLSGLVTWGVYHLNQVAVRKDLEPRRQELKTLLASLN